MKTLGMIVMGLVFVGCGGHVVAEDGGSGGSGTDNAGGGGAGGAAATTTTECVVQSTDPNGGWVEPTCDTLSAMIVSNPSIQDDSGDGKVSPGETAIVTVDLHETTGVGFYSYPNVIFSSDVAGVTVTNEAMLYGIGPCDTYPMATLVTVGAGVPKGTVVHIGAQVAMLSLECPDAFAITVPLQVQ